MSAATTIKWTPVLEGALRAKAEAAVREIAAALSQRSDDESAGPTLAAGSAGLAVYYSYLARSGFGDDRAAVACMEKAMNAASAMPMDSSLYGGITGIGWVMAHLRGELPDDDAADATEELDNLLLARLRRKPWRGDYDLIGGLVGLGVYALESWPAPPAEECLQQVIERLDEMAIRTSAGLAWFTAPELLPEWQRELCPKGYYNLGLAHGVPGVIAFLAQVCARSGDRSSPGRSQEQARELLNGAVPWLLAQKNKDSVVSVFPSWTGPGVPRETSRVAWCYGDLGIAAALLAAARCLGNALWEQEALQLAHHVAKCPEEETGVADCGLCHGAAGVGHLFNRLFQATGDPAMKEAAHHWFRRALEMRRLGNGIAGFAVWSPEGWRDEVGILEGAAGIALALLSSVRKVEPGWDRMMLLSMPKSGAANGEPS